MAPEETSTIWVPAERRAASDVDQRVDAVDVDHALWGRQRRRAHFDDDPPGCADALPDHVSP